MDAVRSNRAGYAAALVDLIYPCREALKNEAPLRLTAKFFFLQLVVELVVCLCVACTALFLPGLRLLPEDEWIAAAPDIADVYAQPAIWKENFKDQVDDRHTAPLASYERADRAVSYLFVFALIPMVVLTVCFYKIVGKLSKSCRNPSIRPADHLRFAYRGRRVDCGRCVVISVARIWGSTTTSNVYCRDVDNHGNGEGEPFQLIKFENKTFWTNEEVTNERIKVGSLLNYQPFVPSFPIVSEQSKLDGKQFIENTGGKPQDATKLLLDLQDDERLYRGLKGAHGCVNQKAHRSVQAFLDKNEFLKELYIKLHMACTRIHFIGISACTIKNERVALETVDGELLDMPLNCRESLVLSTAPVHLQLKRPWEVADDDVGGVAVVKCEAGKFTCEGLILRYKPYIISRDEEPVEMRNTCGEVIPVQGYWRVLFDTCNEAATGISTGLLSELNLRSDSKTKRKVKVAGGELCQFETVEIELVIRGCHFKVCALVGALADDTDLVGMDIIQQLFDLGYTIGE